MGRPAATALFLWCFVLNAPAAEQGSFVGTWIYNADKSETLHPVMAMGGMGRRMDGNIPASQGSSGDPGARNPRMIPMTVEQNGNEFKITRVLYGTPSVQAINADGVEHEDMVIEPNRKNKVKVTTKATLKKNRMVVEKVTHYPEWKVRYKGEFEVSNDGNTLTVDEPETKRLEGTPSSLFVSGFFSGFY